MVRLRIFVFSAVGFIAVLAALPFALLAQKTDNPFDANFQHGRVWTNAFFGITWEVPKDLQTNAERQERAAKLHNDEAVQRMRNDDRAHGILLSGSSLQTNDALFDARTTDPT